VKRALLTFASILLLCAALTAQTVCFDEVDTGTGPNPKRGVILDSNGNGKLDLALIAGGTQGYGIGIDSLLGNGDGSFSKLRAYHGPGLPTSLTTGDFNHDGKADVAISFDQTSNTTGIVAILLGNGDGTFGSVHSMATAQPANTIVAGDFNGDGKLDVAVTTGPYATSTADIELLLGNGDGSLQSPTVLTTLPWYTTALSVADLNGDGKLDLVSDGGNTNDGGQIVTVLLGNGNGTFQTPASYPGPLKVAQTIAIADFNGDGHPDVAVPSISGISLFSGSGTGALTGPASVSMSTDPLSLAAIDLFGNGAQSLVGSDGTGQNYIGIAINDGTGNFTSQSYKVAGPNYYVYPGDFNNDGKTDLLILYIDSSRVGVLLNCS